MVAQVVLALQLPFTLIPLIKATSSHALMGRFASSWLRSGVAWAASFVVSAANLLMLLDMLRMDAPEPRGAAGLKEWSISGGFQQWLQHVRRSFDRCAAAHTLSEERSMCAAPNERWSCRLMRPTCAPVLAGHRHSSWRSALSRSLRAAPCFCSLGCLCALCTCRKASKRARRPLAPPTALAAPPAASQATACHGLGMLSKAR